MEGICGWGEYMSNCLIENSSRFLSSCSSCSSLFRVISFDVNIYEKIIMIILAQSNIERANKKLLRKKQNPSSLPSNDLIQSGVN